MTRPLHFYSSQKMFQNEVFIIISEPTQHPQELMEEKRRLKDNLEKVVSSVPEMRDEKDRLAKERDKLERELDRQKRLTRELQDQVAHFYLFIDFGTVAEV